MKRRTKYRKGGNSKRLHGMPARSDGKHAVQPERTPADILLDRAEEINEYTVEFFKAWYSLESTEQRAKKPTARYQ